MGSHNASCPNVKRQGVGGRGGPPKLSHGNGRRVGYSVSLSFSNGPCCPNFGLSFHEVALVLRQGECQKFHRNVSKLFNNVGLPYKRVSKP